MGIFLGAGSAEICMIYWKELLVMANEQRPIRRCGKEWDRSAMKMIRRKDGFVRGRLERGGHMEGTDFTRRAQTALRLAQESAAEMGHG